MSKWKKAPEELVEVLGELVKGVDCEPRKMFGYACYFINGNMFLGCFEDSLIIRLSEGDREAVLEELSGAAYFEPLGRRMKEYMTLPRQVWEDPDSVKPWVEVSAEFVRSLPAKAPKKRTTKKNKKK